MTRRSILLSYSYSILILGQSSTLSTAFTSHSTSTPSTFRLKNVISITSTASSTSSSTSTQTQLNAFDSTDPYADIAKNYGYKAASKKAAVIASTPSIPSLDIDTSTVTTTATTTTTTPSPEEIVNQVAQAASSAMDASTQASKSAASISTLSDKAPSLYEMVTSTSGSDISGSMDNMLKSAKDSLQSAPSNPFSSGTAASSTSSSASSSLSEGKVPTLFDYLKSPDSIGSDLQSTKEKLADVSNTIVSSPLSQSTRKGLSEARESIKSIDTGALKSSASSLKVDIDTDGISQMFSSTSDSLSSATKSAVAAATAAAGAASSTIPSTSSGGGGGGISGININTDAIAQFNLQEALAPLQLETYGPWYITAIALTTAVTQRNAGKEAARAEYEAQLEIAQKRADEAAEAALVAAQGARLAKELVEGLNLEDSSVGSKSLELLEKSRLEQLVVEKEILESNFGDLVQETNSLRNQIDTLLKPSSTASSNEEEEEPSPEIEIPIIKTTMERDPDEDAKILQVLKEIDDENAQQKKQVEEEEAAVLQSKATELQEAAKRVEELENAVLDAKTKVATTKKKRKSTTKKTKTKASKAKKTVKATKAETSVKKAAAAEVKETPHIVSKDDAPTIQVTKVDKPKKKKVVKKKKATKVKKAAPAPAPVAVAVAAVVDDGNPWGKLKESTLKRKTIAQLTAYMEERKMFIDGMSKADMVNTIQGANVSV